MYHSRSIIAGGSGSKGSQSDRLEVQLYDTARLNGLIASICNLYYSTCIVLSAFVHVFIVCKRTEVLDGAVKWANNQHLQQLDGKKLIGNKSVE